jgi:hypothetical protein
VPIPASGSVLRELCHKYKFKCSEVQTPRKPATSPCHYMSSGSIGREVHDAAFFGSAHDQNLVLVDQGLKSTDPHSVNSGSNPDEDAMHHVLLGGGRFFTPTSCGFDSRVVRSDQCGEPSGA